MDIEKYNSLINDIFQRFPSVQTSSFNDAYKPGLQHMTDFNNLLGNPDKKYRTIHVVRTEKAPSPTCCPQYSPAQV